MKRKYKNIAVGLAALNFLSLGTNAEKALVSKNLSKTGKSETTKDKRVIVKNNEILNKIGLLAASIILVPPTVDSSKFVGKKIFYSRNHYYLSEIIRKASSWKKVEDIIMSSAYFYLVSSDLLWKASLEKLQRQMTGYVNTAQANDGKIDFNIIKTTKISELQDKFSNEINEFREFISNRLDPKKDYFPQNAQSVYNGVFKAEVARNALVSEKEHLDDNNKKSEFDKSEREIIAWLLIAFVDDSSITNLTFDQLTNGEEGKKIIDSIITGQEN